MAKSSFAFMAAAALVGGLIAAETPPRHYSIPKRGAPKPKPTKASKRPAKRRKNKKAIFHP